MGVEMGLKKQAKVLTKGQAEAVLNYLATTRYPERNRVIFLLSSKAGLRAKEIASLTWAMVVDAEGELRDTVHLQDVASKGSSGGVIPMGKIVRKALAALQETLSSGSVAQHVIQTERSSRTSPQVIVNLFAAWYRALGFQGCSSHSGRRTFITNAAKNIGRFGGSLRDVQALARHRSLATTQKYIEVDTRAMRRVVDAL